VQTAPHVDFFTEPCPDWDRHVDHWLARFHDAADSDPPAVVGISFGAHVGWDLWHRLPPGAMSALVLISYWPLADWQRRGLSGLRRLPRLGGLAVGTTCFRWSELRAADAGELRALRRVLYDEEPAPRRRLWARLVSLADAPPAPPAVPAAPAAVPAAPAAVAAPLPAGPVPPADRAAVGFVYARAEWPLRAMRRRRGGTLPDPTVLVNGDHSVSLDGSVELATAVERLIGQPANRGDSE